MTMKEIDEVDPFVAMQSLREALAGVGVVLPSLGVDPGSPALKLVELGRVRADVAARLAEALRPVVGGWERGADPGRVRPAASEERLAAMRERNLL